jgi:hypothetical protein
MALKGTLRDFSVADIFQLIGQQQKSGSLFIRTKEKEAHIVFDAGKLVLGTFRKSDPEFLLGTMLLRAGVITSDQLNQAIANQKSSLRSLGDILMSIGALQAPALGEFVALQLKEILFRLFQWKDGLYEFIPEQIRYNKAIIKPQSAEGALMDCFRMLDEWPAISRKIVSTEAVFRSLVDPLDLTDDVGTDGGEKESALTEEDRKILRFFDGHRSLQEVIYLSRLGTFDTCRIAAGLLDRGLALKTDHLSSTRVARSSPSKPEGISSWLAWSYRFLLVVFALSVLLPVVALGVRSAWSDRYGETNPAMGRIHRESLTLSSLRRDSDRKILANALELARMEEGEYPRSLDELGLGSFTSGWEYARDGNNYKLTEGSSRDE